MPDISFPSAIDPAETGESVEDNALPWDSIKPAGYKKLHNYNTLVPILAAEHQARIKDNMEFGFINEDILTYKKEKDINTISLNEKTRVAEQDKEDSDRLARLNKRQKVLGKKPFADLDAVPKDYEAPDVYLDEAVAITADFSDHK